MEGKDPLLSVRNLTVRIKTPQGEIIPVRELSFDVHPGEILAIVGESGSGKTLSGLSLLGLTPKGSRIQGEIFLRGTPIQSFTETQWNTIRGARIGLVFQEPQSALNPILTIGTQIEEILRSHSGSVQRSEETAFIRSLLERVGLQNPDRIAKSYPHQLSGGMRQRVMIAMATALDPELLILDEPTTALDVTMATQILSLLIEENHRRKTAMILISHDLSVVKNCASRILVMYAGRIIEKCDRNRFFNEGPDHPYSQALLKSRPEKGDYTRHDGPLEAIGGQVPPLWDLPEGCAFSPRCQRADERCRTTIPPWKPHVTSSLSETSENLATEGSLCFYPGIFP